VCTLTYYMTAAPAPVLQATSPPSHPPSHQGVLDDSDRNGNRKRKRVGAPKTKTTNKKRQCRVYSARSCFRHPPSGTPRAASSSSPSWAAASSSLSTNRRRAPPPLSCDWSRHTKDERRRETEKERCGPSSPYYITHSLNLHYFDSN